jgi:hypothetical protein
VKWKLDHLPDTLEKLKLADPKVIAARLKDTIVLIEDHHIFDMAHDAVRLL